MFVVRDKPARVAQLSVGLLLLQVIVLKQKEMIILALTNRLYE